MIRKFFLAFFMLLLASSLFSQQKNVFKPLLMPPKGHTSWVITSSFSPDEQYLMTGGMDQTAKVWDIRSGKLLLDLIGHKQYVTSVKFSPDMKKIVTTSYDKTARLYDFENGELLHILKGHTRNITGCQFSPDGSQLMTHARDTINFWNVETGALIRGFNGHAPAQIYSATYSPDGKSLITTSSDSTTKFWDVETLELKMDLTGHLGTVWCAIPNKDGTMLATACDTIVRVWDIKSASLIREFDSGVRTGIVPAFSHDNSRVLFTAGPVVKVFDLESGSHLFDLKGHESHVYTVVCSPDGKHFLTASQDGTARVWDSQTGKIIYQTLNHGGDVYNTGYSPSGKYFISSALSGKSAFLWDASTGALKHEFKGMNYSIISAYFGKDGKTLKHSYGNGTGKVWDLRTGRLLKTFGTHKRGTYTFIYSPDKKKVLTTSGDRTINVYDAESKTLTHTLKGHGGAVFAGRFSPDNKMILSRCGNREVKVWDVESGEVILNLDKEKGLFNSAVYDAEGNYILTGCADSTAKLWEIKTGKMIREFVGHTGNVATANFSANSNRILTASHDNTAKLWNTNTGEEIRTFSGHENPVSKAYFSKDESLILTVSRDHTIKAWNAETGDLVSTLEGHTRTIFLAGFTKDNRKIISSSFDHTAKVWDTESGKLLFDLVGHTSYVTSARQTPDGRHLMTAGADGLIIFWDWNTGDRVLTLHPLANDNWVVVHKSGLFDASPNAMKWMYYLLGREVIELDQLKERYYEPGLFEKYFANESLRDVEAFQSVAMYPQVESTIESDWLSINLTERNGGIGKVSIFINNKEVINDVNPDRNTELAVNLKQFERYFLVDTLNTVSILVFNRDGWLRSSQIKHNYFPGFIEKMGFASSGDKNRGGRYAPELYALIIGTSNYAGDQLDLKYADKDSRDIANAVQQSATVLFGTQKVHLRLFTSGSLDDSEPGSKKNIKAAIDSFALQARAEDILMVYFSGHGVTYGESFEKQQFYYLTKDVHSGDLSDPQIRKSYAISSQEMTNWINSVPAQKQVMILDACSSGKVVEDLVAVRNIPASQVRALDRMKDRTGMFVLAGSAADKVSFEASQYGQGLLTYSLLLGMSGAALPDGQTVDVMSLFQYARDRVPEFAKDVGGVQIPTLAFPADASSFDIGLVTDEVKIPVQQVKPIFIRSNLFEMDSWDDLLGLSKDLDTYMANISSGPQSLGIIFVDVTAYEGAYSIKGQYQLEGDAIRLKGRLFKGKERLGEFNIEEEKDNSGELVNLILEEVMEILNE